MYKWTNVNFKLSITKYVSIIIKYFLKNTIINFWSTLFISSLEVILLLVFRLYVVSVYLLCTPFNINQYV